MTKAILVAAILLTVNSAWTCTFQISGPLNWKITIDQNGQTYKCTFDKTVYRKTNTRDFSHWAYKCNDGQTVTYSRGYYRTETINFVRFNGYACKEKLSTN